MDESPWSPLVPNIPLGLGGLQISGLLEFAFFAFRKLAAVHLVSSPKRIYVWDVGEDQKLKKPSHNFMKNLS